MLIALMDANHSLHARATGWFSDNAKLGWASSPITQNGCIRIMSHPGYPNAQPVAEIMHRLANATASELHVFWPDSVGLLDPQISDSTRILGPRQITDVYLLALAVKHSGRFVTFDNRVSLSAIHGALPRHLVTL